MSGGSEAGAGDNTNTNLISERKLLFTAVHGGGIMGFDMDSVGGSGNVVVLHRLANAMLGEVVLIPGGDASKKRVIARDGRLEYCMPRIAFLADGSLVARLNITRDFLHAAVLGGVHVNPDVNGMPATEDVIHGLWLLDAQAMKDGEKKGWTWCCKGALGGALVGQYDVCSSSYGSCTMREGFVLDSNRTTIAFTARSHNVDRGMSDQLFVVPLLKKKGADANGGLSDGVGSSIFEPLSRTVVYETESHYAGSIYKSSGKGCHVPVALSAGTGSAGSSLSLVYHFRSPTEAGDLWLKNNVDCTNCSRLTYTMQQALRAKLKKFCAKKRFSAFLRP